MQIKPDCQNFEMNYNTIQRFSFYRFVSCSTCAKIIFDPSPVYFSFHMDKNMRCSRQSPKAYLQIGYSWLSIVLPCDCPYTCHLMGTTPFSDTPHIIWFVNTYTIRFHTQKTFYVYINIYTSLFQHVRCLCINILFKDCTMRFCYLLVN